MIHEERHAVERLLAQTHQIGADAVVDDAVLGELGELVRHFVDAVAGRDHQRHHARAVKGSIDKVTLEHGRRQIERLEKVSLGLFKKKCLLKYI